MLDEVILQSANRFASISETILGHLQGESMKSVLIASLLCSFSTLSFANSLDLSELSKDERKALTITSVETYEVEPTLDKGIVEMPKAPTPTPTPTPGPTKPGPAPLPTGTPLDEISIILDNLIAIGKKIWPIIDAGRPVVSTKLAPAVSIVPHLQTEAGVLLEMENWSMPKVTSVRVSFKNGFGSEVVGFTYTIIFQYNGDYQGTGKYVTNLRIVPSDIYAGWGFNFDAASELQGISNVGTSVSPVASGIINISYAVRGLLNERRNASSIYVDGRGNIQFLNL